MWLKSVSLNGTPLLFFFSSNRWSKMKYLQSNDNNNDKWCVCVALLMFIHIFFLLVFSYFIYRFLALVRHRNPKKDTFINILGKDSRFKYFSFLGKKMKNDIPTVRNNHICINKWLCGSWQSRTLFVRLKNSKMKINRQEKRRAVKSHFAFITHINTIAFYVCIL